MSLQRTSREIWREHANSVTFLLERAENEGGRAGGPFGPRLEQLVGTATALRLICRRCDGDKGHHTSRDHEFDPRPAARVAYRFVWVQGSGARGEIELDASMSPIWAPYARPR
jgi:hypothetical protein